MGTDPVFSYVTTVSVQSVTNQDQFTSEKGGVFLGPPPCLLILLDPRDNYNGGLSIKPII